MCQWPQYVLIWTDILTNDDTGQAIVWASYDPYLRRPMKSLDQSVLSKTIGINVIMLMKDTDYTKKCR